jgi:hypothetical protein
VRWVGIALLGTLFLTAACGGDDDESEPTGAITPVGTKAETPTPAPDGGGGGPPAPPSPQLDEELTEIAANLIVAVVEPGSDYAIDTIATAAADSGDASLSCDTSPNFAFGFTWQVQDPYPPDGVQLSWQLSRPDGAIDIANSTSGEQTVGCETLTAVNDGDTTLTVAVKYRAGVIQ